jgi:hypothetical protein
MHIRQGGISQRQLNLIRAPVVDSYVMPLHTITGDDEHWSTVHFRRDSEEIFVYDSLSPLSNPYESKLQDFARVVLQFEEEYPRVHFINHIHGLPAQTNNVDCGMYTLAFLGALLCGTRPETLAIDVRTIRRLRAELADVFRSGFEKKLQLPEKPSADSSDSKIDSSEGTESDDSFDGPSRKRRRV